MYTSAGIPGTGLYAVHHFRSADKAHPEVQSDVSILIGVLLALLIVAVLVIAANWR